MVVDGVLIVMEKDNGVVMNVVDQVIAVDAMALAMFSARIVMDVVEFRIKEWMVIAE